MNFFLFPKNNIGPDFHHIADDFNCQLQPKIGKTRSHASRLTCSHDCTLELARGRSQNFEKIGFDISKIDENGLRGPAGGQTSVAYEFCIISWQSTWEEVQKIDPTLKFNSGQGRINCARNYWCVLGSTSGKDWRERLLGIAKLEYITEIQETVWE